MPTIHLIPSIQGMSREELSKRLAEGWVLVGRQVINETQAIVDPTKPMSPTGKLECDVWVLPEPTIPAGALASVLVQVFNRGADGMVLNAISRPLLGQGILELARVFAETSAAEVGEGEDANKTQ